MEISGREYLVIVERDDRGWFTGSVAGLPGVAAAADRYDECVSRVREQIEARVGRTARPAPGAVAPRGD